jgi:L-fucose/D-arabinose isomerase
VLWTNDQPDCHGLIGAAVTKGGLEEVGIDAPLVYGDFDDAPTLAEVKMLCTGAAAAARLRGSRYGLGGTRALEMLTASVDPNAWLTQFGVDVDGWDELDVVERSKEVNADKAAQYIRWLQAEFGGVHVDRTVVDMSVRLYLALKQVIAEKRFDFISVKCLPTMARVWTSFCLPHALLGDACDAEGPKERVVCACESDSNGALSMQIMKHVDDQAIHFADVRNLDLATNTLRISNCGSSATELASSRKDVVWVKHGLKELPWKHGGMCPQYVGKAGRVTLARLSRIAGRYVMLIAGGEALDMPRAALQTTFWEFSPHTFLRPDAAGKTFVANLRSNHIHMMYGDWRRELLHVCRVLHMEPIVPEGIPQ